MKNYTAPWSTSLTIVSSLVTAICLGVALALVWSGRLWEALVPLAMVCGGALFTVQGYTVTPDAILIHRLFWTTRIPLAGLHSADVEPEAMRRVSTPLQWRLVFLCGWFGSRALSAYLGAFVTDPNRAVVLHFPRRNVVVSPSVPEDFVRDIRSSTHAA
jgi:hypothetical protein